jgi:glycosyltransferase involved in cell wall biosynthesis
LSLAHGVPVVVTSVGALPELAMGGDGVVPPGDAEALARALIVALSHDEGHRVRVLEFARAKFDWTTVAEAYGALYERLVAA